MLTSREFTDFLFEAYDLIEVSKKEQARAMLTETLLSLGLPIQEEAIDKWIVLVADSLHYLEQAWENNLLEEKLEFELIDIKEALLNKKTPKQEKEVLQAREQEILLIIQNWQDEVLKKRDEITVNPPKNKIEELANMLHVSFSPNELSGIQALINEAYNRRYFQYAHSKTNL